MNDTDNGPRIPIPGAAGATIAAELRRVAMYCGDCESTLTIKKQRLPNGGYTYLIATKTPARPARQE